MYLLRAARSQGQRAASHEATTVITYLTVYSSPLPASPFQRGSSGGSSVAARLGPLLFEMGCPPYLPQQATVR